jgi:hypothetical protein
MSDTWEEASSGDAQQKLLAAASSILDGRRSICCPLCAQASLRFYCSAYGFSPTRGTIWVWCAACRKWAHLGRVHLRIRFVDPIDDETARRFSSSGRRWIDFLDGLWETGELFTE